jgi:hypothetical protein
MEFVLFLAHLYAAAPDERMRDRETRFHERAVLDRRFNP